MRIYVAALLCVLTCLAAGESALAADDQRIADLKAQIEQLERAEAALNQNIAGEREKANTLAREIAILRNQIGAIEAQIAATDRKIDLNREEQGSLAEQIEATRAEMSQKRATIGRMILFLQQRDQEDLVASLLKYANLSAFVRQLDDIAEVQHKLLATIEALKADKEFLEQSQEELADKEQELVNLNDQAAVKRSQLVDVKVSRDQVLKTTKGQEAAYQAQLKALEEAKARLFTELIALEPQIIAGGKYLVRVTAASVPPSGTKLFSWPKGCRTTTQGYGMTAYARRGAYGGAGHNGLDISCGFGSPNLAIGDGQVIANGNNKGWGIWVAVRHPNDMVSIYAHNNSLSVKAAVGSQVKTGDVLGYEGKTGYVTGAHLHLSLYRDFFTYMKGEELYFNYGYAEQAALNPASYLK